MLIEGEFISEPQLKIYDKNGKFIYRIWIYEKTIVFTLSIQYQEFFLGVFFYRLHVCYFFLNERNGRLT